MAITYAYIYICISYFTLNNYNVIIDIFILDETNDIYNEKMRDRGKLFSIHK